MSTSSSVKPIDDDKCTTSSTFDYIPGAATGTISFNAYAFSPGNDRWLGSRCRGSADASQTNNLRYDARTDRYYLIPTKVHSAQITGEIGSVSLGQTLFNGITVDSQLNGSISLTTELGTTLGAELTYEGEPLPIKIPDLNYYEITLGNSIIRRAYINSFNVSVDFPTPATATYNFAFVLDDLTVGDLGG